ncbi:hypothetical protein [Tropicimonas sp. S265A]|uniref:hypothetical protein n=1 Tax=Tropicimonas sp. S265A TaxID=3415134 RepID=UPI003C7B9802
MSRFSADQMCELADEAIASIDKRGRRGTSLVTYDQIEAMACLIVALRDEVQRLQPVWDEDPNEQTEESTDD